MKDGESASPPSIPPELQAYMDDVVLRRAEEIPKLVNADRQRTTQVMAEIAQVWGEPLDDLDALICDAETRLAYQWRALSDDPATWTAKAQALTSLVRRCCFTAREVAVLLRAGLAFGAHARWRTLNELAVSAAFIQQNDDDVAERYVASRIVSDWKEANEVATLLKSGRGLIGARQLSREDQNDLDKRYAEVKALYPGIQKDWGWSRGVLQGDPNFGDVTDAVMLRAPLKLAHGMVHAGAGAFVWDDDPTRALWPPGNFSITAPGASCARELQTALNAFSNHALSVLDAHFINVVSAIAFHEACDQVVARFNEVRSSMRASER